MPLGSKSQQNNAALFSNNGCVNGRALTPTSGSIACLYLFNMLLASKLSSWFSVQFSQRPLVAQSNVRPCCFL